MSEFFGSKEVIAFIRSRTESHNFVGSPSEENIAFCFEALRWLYEVHIVDGYGGTISPPSEGISADSLPSPVKQLTAYDFDGRTHYSSESFIRFSRKPDSEVQPTVLPILQQLRDQEMNYPQIIDHLRANPELVEDIVFGTLYAFDKFEITYEPRLFADWGLSFEVGPDAIQVVPFGKLPQIKTAVSFMLANMERPQITTRTAVELGILAAENDQYSKRLEVSVDAFDAFDERLEKKDTSPKAVPYLGSSIAGVIINILIDDGLVTPPKGLIRHPIIE